ncbi:hypothetical protein GCM10025883_28300 [Mobilicoccus caccae]|uniref:Uncharacterized protein n=1 Tax=Mobilicoccus caccae TaxID=1859295 RepID=A0ABQ6ITT1_9MICO|nr:hypothetical protein GCM10025883_28300 [Mobilicoccus caccae]
MVVAVGSHRVLQPAPHSLAVVMAPVLVFAMLVPVLAVLRVAMAASTRIGGHVDVAAGGVRASGMQVAHLTRLSAYLRR